MWLIEVIDFLYFRHQRSQDHAFSLFEEYQHSQFCSASEQKCHQKRPHHSESLPKFEAAAVFLAKTLVNDCTKATLHNPLPTKPRFFRRRWKWWRSGGIKFRGGFSCQVPGSQRSNPSNSGWNVNEIHGQCGIQEIIWWRTCVGEIQKKPQEAVCPPDQGDLHQARQNYHWKPLPDMQRRIFGLGLQKCEAAATLHRPLHWPNPSNSKDKHLSETVQAARHWGWEGQRSWFHRGWCAPSWVRLWVIQEQKRIILIASPAKPSVWTDLIW